MKSSSGTQAWQRWPCAAAAITFIVAAPGAFAQSACEPQQQRDDTTSPFGNRETNPCNADNFLFEGTFRNQFRAEMKRDCRTEFRNRDRIEGQGQGAFAEYKVLDDHTTVTRMDAAGQQRRFIEHRDQRIIAQRPTATGKETDLAISWFKTTRTDTRFDEQGKVTKDRAEVRCRCNRDDQTDACPEEAAPEAAPSLAPSLL